MIKNLPLNLSKAGNKVILILKVQREISDFYLSIKVIENDGY